MAITTRLAYVGGFSQVLDKKLVCGLISSAVINFAYILTICSLPVDQKDLTLALLGTLKLFTPAMQ